MKNGIRDCQNSLKKLKEEMELVRKQSSSSLNSLANTATNKENRVDPQSQFPATSSTATTTTTTTSQSNGLKQCVEDQLKTIKKSLLLERNSQIEKAQRDIETVAEAMRSIEHREAEALASKLKQLTDQFSLDSEEAKQAYTLRMSKLQSQLDSDIEREKRLSKESLNRQIAQIQQSLLSKQQRPHSNSDQSPNDESHHKQDNERQQIKPMICPLTSQRPPLQERRSTTNKLTESQMSEQQKPGKKVDKHMNPYSYSNREIFNMIKKYKDVNLSDCSASLAGEQSSSFDDERNSVYSKHSTALEKNFTICKKRLNSCNEGLAAAATNTSNDQRQTSYYLPKTQQQQQSQIGTRYSNTPTQVDSNHNKYWSGTTHNRNSSASLSSASQMRWPSSTRNNNNMNGSLMNPSNYFSNQSRPQQQQLYAQEEQYSKFTQASPASSRVSFATTTQTRQGVTSQAIDNTHHSRLSANYKRNANIIEQIIRDSDDDDDEEGFGHDSDIYD